MVPRSYAFITILTILSVCFASAQKAPGPEELVEAASLGNLSLIDTLLLRGADPDQPDENGETALLYAVKSGRNELVERILDANANPDKPGADKLTALMESVMMSRQDLVILLLSRGADANLITDLSDTNSVSALSLALDRGEYDIARILIEEGGNPLLLADPSQTKPNPLNLPVLKIPLDAELWRNAAILKDFAEEAGPVDWRELRDELDGEMSVDQRDGNGVTALMSSAWFGDTPIVSLLLQRGADSSLRDERGNDALCYAVSAGNIEVTRLLLENLEHGNLNQMALSYAISGGHHTVLDLLLETELPIEGIDTGIDEEGITVLMIAAWIGDVYAVERLLQLSDGGVIDKAGRTALEWSLAGFERDRNTGRDVGNINRAAGQYPVIRLLAGRLRNPLVYSTQVVKDTSLEVINAWSPGMRSGMADDADDWRGKQPSPVPQTPGDGDLTLYRILRDEEPGIPSN